VRNGRISGVHSHRCVAGHPPGLPEEPLVSSGVTRRETRALHHGDGKEMGSLAEGLTKNTNLPELLGGINTHLNISYQQCGMKIFRMKLNHSLCL